MLIDYTSYDNIRAALGVSDDDLPDTVLSLSLYEGVLTQEFESVDLTVETLYATTEALASPTAEEIRFLSACDMFATYAVAKQLTASLPLFAARQMTDGKAQVSRFDNPYKDVITQVIGQYDAAKARLMSTFAVLNSSTAPVVAKTYFAVLSPSVDPVTGL